MFDATIVCSALVIMLTIFLNHFAIVFLVDGSSLRGGR